jgi:hypothetical protein
MAKYMPYSFCLVRMIELVKASDKKPVKLASTVTWVDALVVVSYISPTWFTVQIIHTGPLNNCLT